MEDPKEAKELSSSPIPFEISIAVKARAIAPEYFLLENSSDAMPKRFLICSNLNPLAAHDTASL
jgi:hypothetical protein